MWCPHRLLQSRQTFLCNEYNISWHTDHVSALEPGYQQGSKDLRGTENRTNQGFGIPSVPFVASFFYDLIRSLIQSQRGLPEGNQRPPEAGRGYQRLLESTGGLSGAWLLQNEQDIDVQFHQRVCVHQTIPPTIFHQGSNTNKSSLSTHDVADIQSHQASEFQQYMDAVFQSFEFTSANFINASQRQRRGSARGQRHGTHRYCQMRASRLHTARWCSFAPYRHPRRAGSPRPFLS